MSRLASLALAVFVLICSSGAHAQSMDQRAEELRQKAEAAYFEMEMDDAISSLDQALSLCVMGCSDAMRAKLLVMRGAIVLVARNDEAKARKNFEDALALDPEVRPDPMLSNPKVDRVFEETRARGDEAPADEPDATEDLDAAEESAASETRVIRRKVKWHRVFLEAGYSLTMASAHENMRAASDPVIANPGDDPQLDAIPENDSYILSGTHGCSAPQGGYCVRKTEGLTALAHGLHIGGGYFISERFALGARLRWNPNAGEGTLSHFLLGVRAYYQLTEQKLRGFHASIYGGAMLGQIQVRPKQRPTLPGGDIDRPWARTGLGGLEIGAKLGHRFTRNFGIFGAPEFYTLFPDFSFGLQVTGGVEITFGEAEREVVETQTVAQSVLADEDGDGIPDDRDQCPDEPEDIDGYQDLDGCPDPDNDGDGIPDTEDECSELPEDGKGKGAEKTDGCPIDA